MNEESDGAPRLPVVLDDWAAEHQPAEANTNRQQQTRRLQRKSTVTMSTAGVRRYRLGNGVHEINGSTVVLDVGDNDDGYG
ncbi:hypothetical protein Droror1_Dr00027355 [Drosera rotundifolia]